MNAHHPTIIGNLSPARLAALSPKQRLKVLWSDPCFAAGVSRAERVRLIRDTSDALIAELNVSVNESIEAEIRVLAPLTTHRRTK